MGQIERVERRLKLHDMRVLIPSSTLLASTRCRLNVRFVLECGRIADIV